MDFTQLMSSSVMLNGSLIHSFFLLVQELEKELMLKSTRESKFGSSTVSILLLVLIYFGFWSLQFVWCAQVLCIEA